MFIGDVDGTCSHFGVVDRAKLASGLHIVRQTASMHLS
jgi:hypothetical protein